MSINSAEIALFISKIKEILPLKIEKLYIPEKNIIVFSLYGRGIKRLLLIEVASNYAGIFFISNRPEQKLVANIQNKFRNLLGGGNILKIEQIKNDRVLRFTIKNKGINRFLIVEVTGRRGNVFILNENNVIDAILLPNKKDKRNLALYSEYSPIENLGKITLKSVDFKCENDFWDCWEKTYYLKFLNLKKLDLLNSFEARKRRRLKKINKKKKALLKDLENLKKYSDYKKYGELLKAQLHKLKRGDEFVSVIDYYEENMPEIKLKLDKKKTPLENMEFYFKKYEKYKRGVKYIENELDKLEIEIKKVNESVYENHEENKTFKSVNKKKNKTHKPYKTYLNKKGFKILVGKSGTDNDYLTFKVASGNDIWLHVLSYQGAHVVIKRNNKRDIIDINTIYEAAHLAIINSKAPKNDSVEVCYTFRKFVKKPPKSKPGAVIYTQEKRLYLQFDNKVIKNLELLN